MHRPEAPAWCTGTPHGQARHRPVRVCPPRRSRPHPMTCLSRPLQLWLEDLLGDLRHARRRGDLGRLALVAYCDVRRWARTAGAPALAELSAQLVTRSPCASREEFLAGVDDLIGRLEDVHAGAAAPAAAEVAAGSTD